MGLGWDGLGAVGGLGAAVLLRRFCSVAWFRSCWLCVAVNSFLGVDIGVAPHELPALRFLMWAWIWWLGCLLRGLTAVAPRATRPCTSVVWMLHGCRLHAACLEMVLVIAVELTG